MSDPLVRTPRLLLEPMSCALMRAVMDAEWSRVDRLLGAPFPPEWRQMGWHWLEARLVEGQRDPRLLGWGNRLARRDAAGQADGEVIAEVGFHGPPGPDGWVEIGYQVVAAHRRRGYAREAADALVAWAVDQGVAGVRACIDPGNDASVGVARALGFVHVGTRTHATLGAQLVFERAATASG